ncbi:DNA-binding Lrp family transcriptional regulator [Luteimonas cucumeris]|uniref:DNA-binding Lrp family transcriptional regulator n=1 Tax=Luteimonas cucumeris TaxID=985012 RepID=A0A562L2B9_9GAMM|nr:Lrp/AsnC family transcriptional regulator [Luteimonas cucumeris]TWI01810.1 DNA-binding Lrp family transcriptional regulator [Luteimonas cucumeris]
MTAAPLPLDDFDHRLLELLQHDAAATLTALGDEVGLSPSAVQRRLTRYRKNGLLRQVAVLDPAQLGNVTLVAVMVTMERESAKQHAAFCTRMRAAPEVQQCYVLAGDWDYLVILATTSVAHYREVAERLFLEEGNIKRYDTRLVFKPVKLGLNLPTRMPVPRPARRRK